ncbi:RNA polymerase sigma factor [Cohnella cellulosilytica]|uniref:RNA polymerase sigma factor n=1 Tax=Cohnella cellulosilytica TaxID=986710 RepID=A0ABW2F7N4_9BACL
MGAYSEYEVRVLPHLRELQNYCWYLTKSKWDAEDLLQETLLKALVFFLHAEPYVDVKPFLIRVARNLWIDACRKRQRRRLSAAHHDRQNAVFEDSDYAEVRGTIEWLAERLPRRNIEIWLLFHFFGYSMQEIALATDVSVSAVKSLLHRTRETLRGRGEASARRAVIRRDVERWSRAVMQERPQAVLSER